jgi:hypothetical protein
MLGLSRLSTHTLCIAGEMLSQLRHPNVLSLLGVCMAPPAVCMVTEFMERGSLFDVLLRMRRRTGRWLHAGTPGHSRPDGPDASLDTLSTHRSEGSQPDTSFGSSVRRGPADPAAAAGDDAAAATPLARGHAPADIPGSAPFLSTLGMPLTPPPAAAADLLDSGRSDSEGDSAAGPVGSDAAERRPLLSSSAPVQRPAAAAAAVRGTPETVSATPTALVASGPRLPLELVLRVRLTAWCPSRRRLCSDDDGLRGRSCEMWRAGWCFCTAASRRCCTATSRATTC